MLLISKGQRGNQFHSAAYELESAEQREIAKRKKSQQQQQQPAHNAMEVYDRIAAVSLVLDPLTRRSSKGNPFVESGLWSSLHIHRL